MLIREVVSRLEAVGWQIVSGTDEAVRMVSNSTPRKNAALGGKMDDDISRTAVKFLQRGTGVLLD